VADIHPLKDEIELLEAQRLVKQAQLDAAITALKGAELAKAIAQKTFEKGAMSQEELAKVAGEKDGAQGQVLIRAAELKEHEVRLAQAKRRLAARSSGRQRSSNARPSAGTSPSEPFSPAAPALVESVPAVSTSGPLVPTPVLPGSTLPSSPAATPLVPTQPSPGGQLPVSPASAPLEPTQSSPGSSVPASPASTPSVPTQGSSTTGRVGQSNSPQIFHDFGLIGAEKVKAKVSFRIANYQGPVRLKTIRTSSAAFQAEVVSDRDDGVIEVVCVADGSRLVDKKSATIVVELEEPTTEPIRIGLMAERKSPKQTEAEQRVDALEAQIRKLQADLQAERRKHEDELKMLVEKIRKLEGPRSSTNPPGPN
jgi:hypothetical protein